MTSGFRDVIAEADFPASGTLAIVVDEWHLFIARRDGDYHAVNDRCTHAASPLSTGRVRHGVVMCPLHGARFELAGGRCIGGGNPDLRTFAVRVVDGRIEVAVPAKRPGINDLPVVIG